MLGTVGHQQTQHESQHRIPPQIALVLQSHHPAEQAIGRKAHYTGEQEEQHDLSQHQQNALVSAGHAADNGQSDQAQNVVDQCRRQDGVAHLGIQLAQLFQRLHSDAD